MADVTRTPPAHWAERLEEERTRPSREAEEAAYKRYTAPGAAARRARGEDTDEPTWLTPGLSEAVQARAQEEAAAEGDYIDDALLRRVRREAQTPTDRVASRAEATTLGAASQIPFSGEVAAAVQALSEPKRDIRTLPGRYRRLKEDIEERTERASSDHPNYFYPAAGVAMLGTSLVPFGGGARNAKTIGQAAKSAAKSGFVMGALDAADRSQADLTKGDLSEGKQLFYDAVTGGLVAAPVAAALGAGAHKLTGGAPARAVRDLVQQTTEGALPAQARRLVGRAGENAEDIAGFVGKWKVFKKALGNPKEMADAAERVAREQGAATAPISQKFDAEIGHVPNVGIQSQLRASINEAVREGHHSVADTLRLRLKQFEEMSVANGAKVAKNGVLSGSITHRKLRDWVTDSKKELLRTMGGIAETERYAVAEEAHEAVQGIWNGRLNNIEQVRPDLAPDVEKLRGLNKDIAIASRLEEAATSAEAAAYWKKRNPLLHTVAAGAAGTAMGVGAGLAPALAAFTAAEVAPGALAKMGRGVNKALAALSDAAGKGPLTQAQVQAALKAGVPPQVVQQVSYAGIRKLGRSAGVLGKRVGAQAILDNIEEGVPVATGRIAGRYAANARDHYMNADKRNAELEAAERAERMKSPEGRALEEFMNAPATEVPAGWGGTP